LTFFGLLNSVFDMGRTGIATDEEAFLMRIGNILMSDACQKIDFEYARFHLTWVNYTAIALSAISPDPKPDRLRVTVAGVPNNQDATYAPSRNTITVKAWSFGATALAEQAVIVHECTHAAIDQQRSPRTIRGGDGEIVAYIAQALFVTYSGQKFGSGNRLFDAAQEVADSIKDKPGASLSVVEVARLANAITNSPAYGVTAASRIETSDGVPF
jgi:hypothetical protein